ncbi:AzlC family ABC transporter permease [Acuticoccus mangrovi]|uniref:AzlC family ABC transporter permease n=1 Tax=Acuticoccus mangrovi TaxID=2796142 RepID=A0A934MBF6_9HYPH|nr:AzlC family ABC transporter permease [Acuticoccus mangrovi]MBJ3774072.1 AzlC family ABC transporter permease [Acuticoccus mangrovi]
MTEPADDGTSSLTWFLRGTTHLFSLPALVLMTAQVGFAALAREAGFDVWQSMFLNVAIWALPSQVVFVGFVGSGASLATIMLAVALSGVRFMPMVMSWSPVVRAPNTPRWQLYFLSWFVAITAWVFAMAKLPRLYRRARIPFFAGFAMGLTFSNMAVVGIAHTMLGEFPAVVAAALIFLTPNYFIMALWGSARASADKIALGTGLVLGPLCATVVPGADLLVAGLVGGTFAYIVQRIISARRSV